MKTVSMRKWAPVGILVLALIALAYFYIMVDRNRARVKENQLHGHWELLSATRNGRATNTLENLYFDFNPDGTMETNLFGESKIYEYDQQSHAISQASDPPLEYLIESVGDSTMVVKTDIRDHRFTFKLVKRQAAGSE